MHIALVVYEYVITLDQEISTIWKREWTMSSALLLSIRWAMLLNQIVAYVPASENVCSLQFLLLHDANMFSEVCFNVFIFL